MTVTMIGGVQEAGAFNDLADMRALRSKSTERKAALAELRASVIAAHDVPVRKNGSVSNRQGGGWPETALTEIMYACGAYPVEPWHGNTHNPWRAMCLLCDQPHEIATRVSDVLRGRGVCLSARSEVSAEAQWVVPEKVEQWGREQGITIEVFRKPVPHWKVGKTRAMVRLTCSLGHVTEVMLNHLQRSIRTQAASGGCGVCNGKKCVPGINDLATTDPHVVDRFVDRHEATTVTRRSEKRVTLWCASEGCKNTVTQRTYSLLAGNQAQCGEHTPIHHTTDQFHYVIPVWTDAGKFVGTVLGHVWERGVAKRLYEHVRTAEKTDLVLGDVMLMKAGSKSEAMTRDTLPRKYSDKPSIPNTLGDMKPTQSRWDGWINESVADVWPEEIIQLFSLGDDDWQHDEQPWVRVPIDAVVAGRGQVA